MLFRWLPVDRIERFTLTGLFCFMDEGFNAHMTIGRHYDNERNQ